MRPFETNVSSKYGAPMGRRSDSHAEFRGKVRLQHVPLIDGDYDKGGAYWGRVSGQPIYCAWDAFGHVAYTRAINRAFAMRAFPRSWEYAAGRAIKVKQYGRDARIGEYQGQEYQSKRTSSGKWGPWRACSLVPVQPATHQNRVNAQHSTH